MAEQRIKGQEIALTFSAPSGPQSLKHILNADVEMDITLLEEEYLGEASKSYDDIFNGFKGKLEVHMSDDVFMRFEQMVQDRAQRRDPASNKFALTMTHQFPSGKKVRVTYQDVFFGAMPRTNPSRKDYVRGTINWGCSSCSRVF